MTASVEDRVSLAARFSNREVCGVRSNNVKALLVSNAGALTSDIFLMDFFTSSLRRLFRNSGWKHLFSLWRGGGQAVLSQVFECESWQGAPRSPQIDGVSFGFSLIHTHCSVFFTIMFLRIPNVSVRPRVV